MAPKEKKPEKLDENPAEFMTCDQCGHRRKNPEVCSCARPMVNG